MCVIPLELQDHVLDSLRGNRTALIDCALVCRAWRRRARFNLFHTMNIDWDSRHRTKLLLEILLETHGLVRELTLSSAAHLRPEELVGLLEGLENLESLSILAHRRGSGLLGLTRFATSHPALGERLLLAIARMEQLRAFDFTPRGFLYTEPEPWAYLYDGPALAVPGLRALRSLSGNMLPAPRMHRLWTALAAAKAREGAAPLEHLGTAVHSLRLLACLIRDVGSQLRSLHLDLRKMVLVGEDPASGFRTSGPTLAQCKKLHTLKLYLEAPSARENGNIDACAALFSTATEDLPLAHIQITLYNLSTKFFALPGIAEAVGALDENIVALPHLERVDWDLARCVPDSENYPDVPFAQLFSQLAAQTKRIEVNWTSDMEPTNPPQVEDG
ncbi:hypothetical protein PsYK624_122430 [Phanerochaete sordida]|uniref:F-box domain-containing protein n=1 Tax=Phanerochaete sordida TaxID=48140 RepID=A0A9P3GJ30_9APHY|nr:hypothetical protein PsYK624_122430 [Phanerochaete sordida]